MGPPLELLDGIAAPMTFPLLAQRESPLARFPFMTALNGFTVPPDEPDDYPRNYRLPIVRGDDVVAHGRAPHRMSSR
jgi:hypothetical protein